MEYTPDHSDIEDSILAALAPLNVEKEHFRADSLDKADWCARKAARVYNKLAEKEAAAKRIIQEAQAWLDNEKTKATDEAGFFENHAIAYFLSVRQKEIEEGTPTDKLTKTIKLVGAGAQLQARSTRDSLSIDDEAAAIKWAKAVNPELIRIKEEVKKDETRALIDTLTRQDDEWISPDGEIIPEPKGLSIKRAETTIKLSIPGAKK